MFWDNPTAEDSILMPYATSPYTQIYTSLRRRSFLIALMAFVAILSDFLPMFLTLVPYNNAASFQAHIICSWLSVGILTLMLVVLIAVLLYAVVALPRLLVHTDLIRDSPLVTAMVLAGSSPQLASCFSGVALADGKTRNGAIRAMNLTFSLSKVGDGPGGYHTGVNVLSRKRDIRTLYHVAGPG
jgi:hypothetical protein